MKKTLFLFLLCVLPIVSANARIEYLAPNSATKSSEYGQKSFAQKHRVYIGGAYDFSMWNNYTNHSDITVKGKNTSSYEGMIGYRVSDIFRLEAAYIRTSAEYNTLQFDANTAMLNLLFDARLATQQYRRVYHQYLVPYIGIGGGASWLATDKTDAQDSVTPVVAAMAGLGIELGSYVALDLGYRYMYMFSPHFDVMSGLNPTANQFRAGLRINF